MSAAASARAQRAQRRAAQSAPQLRHAPIRVPSMARANCEIFPEYGNGGRHPGCRPSYATKDPPSSPTRLTPTCGPRRGRLLPRRSPPRKSWLTTSRAPASSAPGASRSQTSSAPPASPSRHHRGECNPRAVLTNAFAKPPQGARGLLPPRDHLARARPAEGSCILRKACESPPNAAASTGETPSQAQPGRTTSPISLKGERTAPGATFPLATHMMPTCLTSSCLFFLSATSLST